MANTSWRNNHSIEAMIIAARIDKAVFLNNVMAPPLLCLLTRLFWYLCLSQFIALVNYSFNRTKISKELNYNKECMFFRYIAEHCISCLKIFHTYNSR